MPGLDGLQTSRHIKCDETLRQQTAIVLVTAFGREEVREEAERLQLDGFLVKPVTKSMIVDTLVNVFAETEERSAVAHGQGDGEQNKRLAGARILLAEDNEINQQIAVELLEGAGATVKVANNGKEAVERLSKGSPTPEFDVVLMDLQMPEMDGYQATTKLRADPRFTTLPIIAMTAHATIEERQRCLAAGMNDHISKPIDPELLFETVGRFYKAKGLGKGTAFSQPLSSTIEEEGDLNGLDVRDGLARVAGNRKLYEKLLRQFVEQQGSTVTQISAAFAQGDTALAERLAHTLKGVAGNIGARTVHSAAGVLEKGIRDRATSAEIESAKQKVAEVLDPLVAQLREKFKTATTPAENSRGQQGATPLILNPVQSREAGTQLMKLLSEFDPGATDFVEAHQAALRPLLDGEAWPQFEKLVQSYSFADAQSRLEAALKKLPAA